MARGVECAGQVPFAREECHRLPLQLALKALVRLEHRPWTRPEGTLVEAHDLRSEEKQFLHSS
jgi:hypothetical protein